MENSKKPCSCGDKHHEHEHTHEKKDVNIYVSVAPSGFNPWKAFVILTIISVYACFRFGILKYTNDSKAAAAE